MTVRDVALFIVVFGLLPVALFRPYFAVLLWSWVTYMNPQRLTWGVAYDFRFSLIVGVTALVSILLSRQPKSIPMSAPVVLMTFLMGWICVTTATSHLPETALSELIDAFKMFALIYATLAAIRTREHLDWLIATIALSIAYYGIKGGLFTILTAGNYRVWGPPDTFIFANNAIGLALLVTIPLLRYLQLQTTRRWYRMALGAAMGLSALGAIATYSRGATLAMAVMLGFLWLRSRQRVVIGIFMIAGIVLGLSVMPQRWWDRQASVQTYEEDGSALGRFEMWKLATKLAVDRPLTGGGFGVFDDFSLYAQYDVDPTYIKYARSVHSIFFEVLGEHGFVGLALYLSLGLSTFIAAGALKRRVRGSPDLQWAGDLGSMIQVSLVGFAVGGLFLNKAFSFPLPFHLLAMLAIAQSLVRTERAQRLSPARSPTEAGPLALEGVASGGAPIGPSYGRQGKFK